MPVFSPTFQALLREAQFTKEMLGSGATQIRKANYASKGIYFQAFTSLSTGLERIGKLCLILSHYIETSGEFPTTKYLKHEIGHKLEVLLEKSKATIVTHSINLKLTNDLSARHQVIVSILHNFAEGDRYSNINLLSGNSESKDPISRWFREVDVPLFESHVSRQKKQEILKNAAIGAALLGPLSSVMHSSETGTEITEFEEASIRTGIYEAVAPHRQLCVLQIIRYWVELLGELEITAQSLPGEDIPFFREIFALFYNDDSYMRTRKTWGRI